MPEVKDSDIPNSSQPKNVRCFDSLSGKVQCCSLRAPCSCTDRFRDVVAVKADQYSQRRFPCSTVQGLTGEAIVNYAKAVWEAFPDMTVELISVSEMGSGQVAHQWLLRGTNSGPLMDGSAATGRTVPVPGNDVIQVEGDKIRSVEVTYDRQAADDQLGGTPA